MKVRRLMFSMSAALGVAVATSAYAEIIITTNMGGADAEVREEQTASDADTGAVTGTNRGAQPELATRIKDDVAVDTSTDPDTITNAFPTNDNSSIMFMKFNISSLPAANDAFWADKEVVMRLRVTLNNLPTSRLWANPPAPLGDPANEATFVRHKFNVRGLNPNGVYIDDNAAAANRVDQNGNAYVSDQYRYDWNEGDNTAGSGIAYVDAPGLTPFCRDGNSCNFAESIGDIEGDYNSDTQMLGEWQWQLPRPANHLPTGVPVDFVDADLKQLVLDAKAAGRTSVTVMVSHALDGTVDKPNVGRVGTTPASMLGFNYNTVPKELLLLQNDTSYDPNTTTPNFPADPLGDKLGSPYSCTFDAVNRPQCTGQGNNSTGAFSPALIIRVPEPASAVLLAMGSLLAWSSVRRRRAA
ncbi:MAG: PEP-CTERM sorting domain-containing protein [Pirellulales bacterium]